MLLLAVGVIYHPVDVDTVTGVHGQDKGKPARAEIGAGLDPGGTETGEVKCGAPRKCSKKQATPYQKGSTWDRGSIEKPGNLSRIHTYFELSLNNLWAPLTLSTLSLKAALGGREAIWQISKSNNPDAFR